MTIRPLISTTIKLQTRCLYIHHRNPYTKSYNPHGVKHELTSDNIINVQNFTSNVPIPDSLALQIITDKSLSNGFKPHNAKLAIYGKKVYKMAVVNRVQNHTVLSSDTYEKMVDEKVLETFTNDAKLNQVMFWSNGVNRKVSVDVFYSVIGAINLIHGKSKCETFINEKVLSKVEQLALGEETVGL